MNQEDFELNENESIKNILTRGVVCQKNIEFKSKIKAMIQYCDKPVLVQLEEITNEFFTLSQRNSEQSSKNLINMISQLFFKLKCIDYLNLFITYYKFINTIKTERIEKDFVNNTTNFISKIDIILKPIKISKDDFSLKFTSTSKDKLDYLLSFIDKEILINNEDDKFFSYDLSYGNYPEGHIIHIIQKNTYFNLREGNYFDFNLYTNKNDKEGFDGDKIKNNVIKAEHKIKDNFILTKRCTSLFHQTYDRFTNFVMNDCPNVYQYIYKIFPFGSVTQCTQNITSNLEITMLTKDYQTTTSEKVKMILEELEKELLENSQYERIELRETKRTILLNCYDKISNIKIELNLNNIFGILNSTLIRNYLIFDSRALILVNTIKDWSKRKGINGNHNGHLSSYCYTLLTIYFLQRIENPVLPILSSKNDTKELKVGNRQYFLEKALCEISTEKTFYSSNTESVATLFIKWLTFYLNMFNANDYCIDIASEKLVFRYDEVEYLNFFKSANKKSVYTFIDMFDYTYNPGAYFEKNSTPHDNMRKAMERTLKQIMTGDDNMLLNDLKE